MALAGITVVASSGNLGKLEGYPEIWESITSPGTSPYAITVYPLNHKGTADRSDDIATTYGSRGPSFGTNFWKPDLAAPGNRITSLLAPDSWLGDERSDSRIGDGYLEMSGGSMAVPQVSASALLLLQAEPRLSPLGIKRVLLASVTHNAQAHPLEQGRGTLNLHRALDLTTTLSEARDTIAAEVTGPLRSPVGRGGAWADGSRWDGGGAWADGLRWGGAWADGLRWGGAWADGSIGGDTTATLEGDD